MNNDDLNNHTPAFMTQEPSVPPQGAVPPMPNMQDGYNPQFGYNPYASQGAMDGYPQPMQSANMQEQVAQAREALGIAQMADDLNAIKNEATYQSNLAEILNENQGISKASIEAELAKLSEKNPALAEQFRLSKDGLSIFVKGLKDTISPNTKIDNITDDTNTTANANSEDNALENKIKNRQANNSELGEFLMKNTK